MKENFTYGSRRQGMETRTDYPRRHPLTLPADEPRRAPRQIGKANRRGSRLSADRYTL
jgi:hypothetical protein